MFLNLNDGRKELYQWDIGRKASVSIDCTEVHFAHLNYADSLAVKVIDGKVEIPNQLLTVAMPLLCWAFVEDADGYYTKQTQTIEVLRRAKPADYLYTETEVISVKDAVKQGLEEAKASGEFDGEKGDKGDKGDTGNSGVYLGSGDMPADCNVQIDPDGDVFTADTFANALKGTASGEAIAITDASPIEHEMGVRVSGVSDISTVKVKKYGKNLLNRNATEVSRGTLTFDGSRQTFTSVGGGGNLETIIGKYKDFVGKTITVSYTFVDYKGGHASFVTFIQADSTALTNAFKYDTTTKLFKMTYTIPENDGAEFLRIRQYVGYMTSADGDYVTIDNLQVEIGDTVTEWEEYKEPIEYPVSADGTVDGVTSIYPTTTLMTDTAGAVIDCTYNRDANKVITDLETKLNTLIATIGG